MTRSLLLPHTLDLHRRAVLRTVALVDAIGDEQWKQPTPCAEWTLAELVEHMTRENRGFAAAVRGERMSAAGWDTPIGADLRAEHASSADEVIASFAGESALARTVWLPAIRDGITLPAREALGFHLLDAVAHGWDVAAATGRPFDADDDTLAAVRAVAESDVPDGPRRRRPGATFAPAVAVPDDAPGLDRLLAFLGRDPGFRSARSPGSPFRGPR
ncbi:TIGR03086 family metal-binding protein [Actinoplanes philippinensis]|nr:TIGR03086 family metal-binding protein [Actinoplanes philippinensis]